VRFLVQECGVTQFLDLGSGIPTVGNVHEIAQAANPQARIVYVDIDPVAVAHSRQILVDNPTADAIRADVRDPEAVRADPVVTRLLDFDQPVAVLLISVPHFIAEDPGTIVRGYLRGLRPGSCLALSHGARYDEAAGSQQAAIQHYQGATSVPVVSRSRDEVLALFDGTDLVEPGLTTVDQWRQDSTPLLQTPMFCGVGRLR
jgi:SAM-dependent methyltransferase